MFIAAGGREAALKLSIARVILSLHSLSRSFIRDGDARFIAPSPFRAISSREWCHLDDTLQREPIPINRPIPCFVFCLHAQRQNLICVIAVAAAEKKELGAVQCHTQSHVCK